MSKKDTVKKPSATKKPLTAAQEAALAKRKAAADAKKGGKKGEIESRHVSELSPKDREYLEELLRTAPDALTEGELGHLAARAAYLTTDERKKYGI